MRYALKKQNVYVIEKRKKKFVCLIQLKNFNIGNVRFV